jgi:hypothetical protein
VKDVFFLDREANNAKSNNSSNDFKILNEPDHDKIEVIAPTEESSLKDDLFDA